MGQQQLLLVILVTILVGIATLVAFNVFGTAAEEANRDAVRQDILAAAAQTQAIWTRPQMMDGAGGDFVAAGMTAADILPRLNIPGEVTAEGVENDNGVYSITNVAAASITIRGIPNSTPDDPLDAVVTRDPETGQWGITWN